MTSVAPPFRQSLVEKDARVQNSTSNHWRLRDTLAAALLFLATAAFVLWQNARVAVLWDLGYLLDTSWRIAAGQMPYRDFPLAHAPLTFLIQAGLIRSFGRHYCIQIAYSAVAGGLATVLAWRILLRILRGSHSFHSAYWAAALLIAAPLPVLGIYSIYPHPIYDCDCTLAVLCAVFLLTRSSANDIRHCSPQYTPQKCHPDRSEAERRDLRLHFRSRRVFDAPNGLLRRIQIAPLAAGAATVLPLFFKQNIGLPFLAVVATGMFILLIADLMQTRPLHAVLPSQPVLTLAGIASALVIGLAAIATTAGLGNYLHWTVQFAAQRRLPGLASLLAIYNQPSFAWTVPTLAAGLILCHTRFIQRFWARIAALCLIAAPFGGSLIFLLIDDDADERADSLLALWPLLLLAAFAVVIFELRRGITLQRLIPVFLMAAIHGTFLSQQLWGSTYALWPLLIVLVAYVLAALPVHAHPVAFGSALAISATLLVCGSLYAASLERLSYVQLPNAPIAHAATSALRGMATPGQFLANFDELADFAAREISQNDALLLLPGEDPFYFATGRIPQFPVTLFDPATDPYSARGLLDEAHRHNVRWVIVKRVLQMNENPMPESAQALEFVRQEFAPYRHLQGYDVYRKP